MIDGKQLMLIKEVAVTLALEDCLLICIKNADTI